MYSASKRFVYLNLDVDLAQIRVDLAELNDHRVVFVDFAIDEDVGSIVVGSEFWKRGEILYKSHRIGHLLIGLKFWTNNAQILCQKKSSKFCTTHTQSGIFENSWSQFWWRPITGFTFRNNDARQGLEGDTLPGQGVAVVGVVVALARLANGTERTWGEERYNEARVNLDS